MLIVGTSTMQNLAVVYILGPDSPFRAVGEADARARFPEHRIVHRNPRFWEQDRQRERHAAVAYVEAAFPDIAAAYAAAGVPVFTEHDLTPARETGNGSQAQAQADAQASPGGGEVDAESGNAEVLTLQRRGPGRPRRALDA